MNENSVSITFGQYLKSKRYEAGLDLDYISAEIKVSKEMLKAIELEDHSRLPEPIYVKGFIRAFAKMVDANENKAVQRYLESRSDYFDITKPDMDFSKRGRVLWPRFAIFAGIVILFIIFVAIGVSFYHSQSRPSFQSTSNTEDLFAPNQMDMNQKSAPAKDTDILQEEPEIATELATEPPQEINGDILPEKTFDLAPVASMEKPPEIEKLAEKNPSSYQLAIQALEETWLKVIIDAERPVEYLLKPGDKITLTAMSQYNLLIGNAGGVQLFLNKQPVHTSGKSGQVINLKLP